MKRLYWGVALLFFKQVCAQQCDSENLGHIAPVYPIFEKDAAIYFREKMMKKQGGEQIKKEIYAQKEKMRNYFLNPQGVSLPELNSIKTHFVDMSFVVKNDVHDGVGNIVAYRGERVNPLHYIDYSHVLCFLDGRSARQLAWGKRNCPEEPVGHFIFVHAPWQVYGRKKRVYFDQYGVLVGRFLIDGLPAQVRQNGLYMEVREGL